MFRIRRQPVSASHPAKHLSPDRPFAWPNSGRKIMQQPFHIISQPGASWTTERIAGVGFVGLLHVIAIWAILNGLAQKFVKIVEPPPIAWTQPVTHQPPPPPAPPIPHVQPTEPTTTAVPLPRFTIQSQDPPQVIGSTTPTRAAAAACGRYLCVGNLQHTLSSRLPAACATVGRAGQRAARSDDLGNRRGHRRNRRPIERFCRSRPDGDGLGHRALEVQTGDP